ncbi:MAG TPA: DUF2911 domain-containing protein [Anaeromyxobacteraceae bacterium]|nr:DUF2911 domain-containing protein [Anaeromyxobacteraceae bacterium]
MTLPCRLAPAALAAALAASSASAQEAPKLQLPRPSPAAVLKQTVGLTDITIAYSSPAVRGRRIWGDVVPYDELWRAGANECTKVTFGTPVSFSGKSVPPGSYCLFLLPTRTAWTLVLNKDTSLWGTSGYKSENDVLRVAARTSAVPQRERLAYEILDFGDDGGTLALEWDTLRVSVRFDLATREVVLASIRALKTDEWRPYALAARYLLDSKIEPQLAMQLVDRSVQLKEHWFNLYVKAQLQAAAGQKKEAVATGERALALGKATPPFPAEDEVVKALAEWKK